MEFLHCASSVSGEAIAQNILSAPEKHSFDVNNLRGLGYDGAGNMAGKYQGAAARIQRNHPKAIDVHCAAHILNLCIVAACKVQHARHFRLDIPFLQFVSKTRTRASGTYKSATCRSRSKNKTS